MMLKGVFATCVLVVLAAVFTGAAGRTPVPDATAAPVSGTPSNVQRVPVDLFVMSKCPDAIYTESHLAPLFQELQQNIELQVHFIGRKQDDGSWLCKHGEEECAGDVQQLCVQQNSKAYNRVKWLLSYVLCNNKQGLDATGSFVTAAKCLQDAHIPLSAATKMLGCMYSPTHLELLEEDFEATASLGVSTSATVQFNKATVAVRDGGRWVRSPGEGAVSDFKQELCSAYASLNRGRLPPQCRNINSSRKMSVV